jgi:hypothetical protein
MCTALKIEPDCRNCHACFDAWTKFVFAFSLLLCDTAKRTANFDRTLRLLTCVKLMQRMRRCFLIPLSKKLQTCNCQCFIPLENLKNEKGLVNAWNSFLTFKRVENIGLQMQQKAANMSINFFSCHFLSNMIMQMLLYQTERFCSTNYTKRIILNSLETINLLHFVISRYFST